MGKSEVEYEIKRQIDAARRSEDGSWITYLIRDPRRPDLRGNTAGWPLYVGQSDEFSGRVRNHLRKSEKLARKGKGIKYRIKVLLHSNVVPNFEVLDRQPTRLQSLLSETNYARLCRSRGYDIANQTTLQNVAGPPLTAAELPRKWLWRFTIRQAIQDNVEIEFVCRECRERLPVPAAAFLDYSSDLKELRDIRNDSELLAQPCTFCGALAARRVSVKLQAE